MRAFALKTLADNYERASLNGMIVVPDHARVQLATANAIHGAIGTADWVYKQVGVHAIFTASAFQRRFRSIKTLFQQIQSRDAHFEFMG